MLMGEYRHALDAKGRLFMPAKLRDDLGEKFIATRGIDKNLFVFSYEEWVAFTQKLRSVPMTDPSAQAFIRLIIGGACECEVDKQGRFLLPQNLREYAGLDKDTVITGLISRVEIWAADKWDGYKAEFEDSASQKFAEMLQSVQQLGI